MPGFTCAVPGCNNNTAKHKHVKFHRFPEDAKQRKEWARRIKRCGTKGQYSIFKPTDSYRICGEHFVGGRKTNKNNVPSIFPWTTTVEKSNVRRNRLSINRTLPMESSTSSSSNKEMDEEPDFTQETVYNQPDHSYNLRCDGSDTAALLKIINEKVQIIADMDCAMQNLRHKFQNSEQNVLRLKSELDSVKQQNNLLIHQKRVLKAKTHSKILDMKKNTLSINTLKRREDMLHFYTGFANYNEFQELFNFIKEDIPMMTYWGQKKADGEMSVQQNRKLSPETSLLILLIRLRCGLLEQDLAYRFAVAQSAISVVCRTYLDLLFRRLPQIPIWPSKEVIRKYMLQCFKDEYPTTRVILDCTEILIETPSHFRVQSETYSTYKSHNTAKGLIGISPNGLVTFVSYLVPGRTSDVAITLQSGLLDLLQEGDSIMADRGFTIAAECANRKVQLNIPPFLNGQPQLSLKDENETRQIARVRIHVERVIAKVKSFRILKYTFHNSMSTELNKMWVVCCHLVNFISDPILSK